MTFEKIFSSFFMYKKIITQSLVVLYKNNVIIQRTVIYKQNK